MIFQLWLDRGEKKKKMELGATCVPRFFNVNSLVTLYGYSFSSTQLTFQVVGEPIGGYHLILKQQ